MLKLIAAAALSVYIVCDATTAPGLPRTNELSEIAAAAKAERISTIPAKPDCSDALWPYCPSDCLTSATLRDGQASPARAVRYVTARRPSANPQTQAQTLAFAQLESQ